MLEQSRLRRVTAADSNANVHQSLADRSVRKLWLTSQLAQADPAEPEEAEENEEEAKEASKEI